MLHSLLGLGFQQHRAGHISWELTTQLVMHSESQPPQGANPIKRNAPEKQTQQRALSLPHTLQHL